MTETKPHLLRFPRGFFCLSRVRMITKTPTQRRKASSYALKLRQVRQIARTNQDNLEHWQSRVAGLRGRYTAGRDAELVEAEARSLYPLVVAARLDLSHDAISAGDDLSRDSILRDLDRAFLRLAETIESMLVDS